MAPARIEDGRKRARPQARPQRKNRAEQTTLLQPKTLGGIRWSSQDAILVGKGESTQLLQLALANRHGLIAGATGTGKTVSLQILAEGFSRQGVPVFMADVKGDLSGISQPATANPKLAERAAAVGLADYAGACLSGRVLGPVRRAGPSDPDHGLGDGPAAARPAARSQRHPGRRAQRRLPGRRRPGPAAARPQGPAGADELRRRERAGAVARNTAGSAPPRSARSSAGC